MTNKKCTLCGKQVKEIRRRFCSYKCAGLARQNYKLCVICGEKFSSPPSAETKTCGNPDCVKQHRLNVSHLPQISGSVDKGREAYQSTLAGQRGPEFHGAKHWVIQAPDGKVYECRNLLHWCRENEHLFDGAARQAWDGIVKIKYSMQGKRKRPVGQWKGWKLLSWSD
ncbi:MAG: hypothetical protein FWG94_08165 [Oscillospiraceae bacterium]|nr:hypothetical protein [Oscillospiraceae bacterium]